MQQTDLSITKNFSHDFPSSIVVFLVAIPLCLGIALASGAPLLSGLIAGVIGGIVVGSISNSALGVSGPAAGLAIIVFSAIEQLGSYPVFLAAVVLAGMIQIIMGWIRAGFISYFFPSAVINGMLAGIGIIIFLKQIPHAVGYDAVYQGSLTFTQKDGFNTFTELWRLTELLSAGPIIITTVSLAILLSWEKRWPPFLERLKGIPASLVAVIAGIFLSWLFSFDPALALNTNQIVAVPVIDDLSNWNTLLQFPELSAFLRTDVWIIAIVMALVASIETLLCTEASDKLDEYKRVTSANRELLAQGMGNMVSGLIGGLPITQVIVRSSSNIVAGAKTKLSTILHGCWILVSVLFFPNLLNQIPLASLASILLLVGYKLARPELFIKAYKKETEYFITFLATVLGLVFTDLLIGILLGLAVSVVAILWSNYKIILHSLPNTAHPENGIRVKLSEHMSFLNKASLLYLLKSLPNDIRVVIDASHTHSMHHDIREVIQDFLINAPTRGIAAEFIQSDRKQTHYDLHEEAINKLRSKEKIRYN